MGFFGLFGSSKPKMVECNVKVSGINTYGNDCTYKLETTVDEDSYRHIHINPAGEAAQNLGLRICPMLRSVRWLELEKK